LLAVAALAASPAMASPIPGEYQFDDLFRPSGVGAQWMVVATGLDTGGGRTDTIPVQTKGYLIEQRDYIYLQNGGITPQDNAIHTMFLVLPETEGSLLVSFDINQTPPPPPGSIPTQDVNADLRTYYDIIKAPLSQTSGTDKLFRLDFAKKSNAFTTYESVKGYFIFHQNPNTHPSQTLNIPFVVANVHKGTAWDNPLLFKMTTRDRSNASYYLRDNNIVAHDRFTWNVYADKMNAGSGDWLFVPITNKDIDKNTVNYHLTTEVTNYTSLRYALQRYDGYWGLMYPTRWAFDLPNDSELPSNFRLNDLSHIPPGLVTTYSQSYNVVSGVKDVLKIYAVDDKEQLGPSLLNMAHRSIFGLYLGTGGDSKNPAAYSATGFELIPANMDFLKKVGRKMDASNVTMPEPSDGVMSGAVSFVSMGSDVICSMAINANVPGRMRGYGLLPLHVTFNLPRANQLVNPKWDTLLKEWRSTGNIRNLFANMFGIYLRNAWGKYFDLTEWLQKVDIYQKTVKVFLDEQRDVITVSFIVLMMDGPNSLVEYVEDSTPATLNTYITIMDGNHNNKWDMTFFVAPKGHVNTDHDHSGKHGHGGGGCNIVFGALLFLACAPLILKRR